MAGSNPADLRRSRLHVPGWASPVAVVLTIAGIEGAHDVKKEMLVPEIIERVRANRLKKKEPELATSSTE